MRGGRLGRRSMRSVSRSEPCATPPPSLPELARHAADARMQVSVSEGTVKNHVSRILTRLGLRDRTQAAVYARDRGLV